MDTSAPLAEPELQAQVQQALNNHFTGQIQITFLDGRVETIFVIRGQVRQVYLRNHRLPDLNWEQPIAHCGSGTLNVEAMPARALMFKKIILEEILPTESQVANTLQLKTFFDLAEHNSGPTLFHIVWRQGEGFVLVAGKGLARRYMLTLTPTGSEEGSVALERMWNWNEKQCTVTIRRGDIKTQAWLEIHLNILFEKYCAIILNHYGQLTGSVMVQSVVRKVSMFAEEAGWNIEASKTDLQAAALFREAAEAGETYREILIIMRSQMEPVIGHALTQNIFKQALTSSRDIYHNLAEVFELLETREV